ncbi:MAG TPA: ribose-phosphate pyrophosphokinase [Clostridiales bacterium]|nr:ribose-phosphate pyrophosphokinase [Clostridiales bacterium]
MADISKEETTKVPYAPLGIIAMDGSKELCGMVDYYLTQWRGEYVDSNENLNAYPGYRRNSFIVSASCHRFSSGEGKAVINDTVRGHDLYIISDIGNYNCTYKMFGMDCPMSPDDHYQDIKRIISAIGGKARRITVIMPMLYEGRQHRRISRESLDCAIALQELERLGVDNILTFDAHDPRVQNAIPLIGFDNIHPTYQIIKALLKNEKDLVIDKSKMMIISPDEGGMSRSLYYSSMLGLDLGLFYKRRDYSRVINGRNPIVAHEFLGDSVEGKDILIVDDLLSTGESVLDIATELKRRKANRIYVAVTFALFTDGLEKFQECYEQGIITKLFATNLTYRKEELKSAPWYVDVDMSKFIAYLIDTLNHDQSISSLLNPSEKINKLLDNYRANKG